MSTFSKATFKSLNYNSFRPQYPPSFYRLLAEYGGDKSAEKPFSKALDIGCGTGIATFELTNLADDVVGLDLSSKMVETANDLKAERCKQLGVLESQIRFVLGDIDSLATNQTFDLITAAQCLHWSKDHAKFFRDVSQLLSPGATFAYFFYVDPSFVDFSGPSKLEKYEALKKAKDIYFKYAYDDPKLIGPHWEQPGRSIIKNFYKDINSKIPDGLFTDVKIENYYVGVDGFKPPSEDKHLVMTKQNTTVNDLRNYLSTYSGLHNFLDKNPDSTILEDFKKELEETTGWTDETKLELVWSTGYTFLKNK